MRVTFQDYKLLCRAIKDVIYNGKYDMIDNDRKKKYKDFIRVTQIDNTHIEIFQDRLYPWKTQLNTSCCEISREKIELSNDSNFVIPGNYNIILPTDQSLTRSTTSKSTTATTLVISKRLPNDNFLGHFVVNCNENDINSGVIDRFLEIYNYVTAGVTIVSFYQAISRVLKQSLLEDIVGIILNYVIE